MQPAGIVWWSAQNAKTFRLARDVIRYRITASKWMSAGVRVEERWSRHDDSKKNDDASSKHDDVTHRTQLFLRFEVTTEMDGVSGYWWGRKGGRGRRGGYVANLLPCPATFDLFYSPMQRPKSFSVIFFLSHQVFTTGLTFERRICPKRASLVCLIKSDSSRSCYQSFKTNISA